MRRDNPFTGLPEPLPLETIRPLSMGLAYAAFAPVEFIERRLGCSRLEANSFQEIALADFHGLMARARAAKATHL